MPTKEQRRPRGGGVRSPNAGEGPQHSVPGAACQRLTLAQIKATVDLVALISRYVTLSRKGRDWWAVCPFHADKNPSFKVDQGRGRYHCFGCDADGDVLDFVCAIERVGVAEAVALLASADRQHHEHRPPPP